MNSMMNTGAGISTGSGLSTYRGIDGKYTEIEKQVGMPVHKLLTPKTLREQPELVWKYWLQFSLGLKGAQPSIAHRAITDIAGLCGGFLEVTQNVDGLSRLAGLPDDQLIELHGTYHRHVCTSCEQEHQLALTEDMAIPPRCYRCRPKEMKDFFVAPVIRPAVVMFDEMIEEMSHIQACTFANGNANLVIVSGTSLQFPYLIEFMACAVAGSARVLYIDPEATSDVPLYMLTNPELDLPGRVTCIRKTADEVFPSLYAFLAGQRADHGDTGDFHVDHLAFESWVQSHQTQ